jgi:prevent-host-death family protein
VKRVNLADAKAHLSELIDDALEGQDVVIARRNVPLVKLVVLQSAKAKPQFGKLKSQIWIAPDFDEPVEDFVPYT